MNHFVFKKNLLYLINLFLFLGIVLIPLLGNVFWYYSIFTIVSFGILGFLINGAFLFHRFFILPKKKLNEELRKIEEEKTQLMDELEEEAIRRKQKDRLEQN